MDLVRRPAPAGLGAEKAHAAAAQGHSGALLVGTRSAGLSLGKTSSKISPSSRPEPARHSKTTQARRHPLTMLRTSRAASTVDLAGREPEKGSASTPTSWPNLGTLANSTADRWRLIAAGRLPADLPKNAAAPVAPAKAAQASTPTAAVSAKEGINRSEPMTGHHQMQELSGNPLHGVPKTLWSYHAEAHDHRDEPKTEDKNGTLGKYTSGGHDKYQEPREFLGLPKIFWALVADLIAMACFVACIPFILTIAKRRRPISSS